MEHELLHLSDTLNKIQSTMAHIKKKRTLEKNFTMIRLN